MNSEIHQFKNGQTLRGLDFTTTAANLPTASGHARPTDNCAVSASGADAANSSVDFTSGHVPYRNDAAGRIDPEAMRQKIPGWGADLDLMRRPGVPREKAAAFDGGVHWNVLPRQTSDQIIHCSIERPGVTPVFGTSCPPHGLSGVIRNFAYERSEDRVSHWMALLAADRVDVVEGWLGFGPKMFGSEEPRSYKRGALVAVVFLIGAVAVVGVLDAVS